MIPKLAPILNAKWEADPQQPDWFWGVDAEGERYLMNAPPGVRDLIVLMQNNAVMERQYEEARAAFILASIESATEAIANMNHSTAVPTEGATTNEQ